ncbi:DUF2142 domain-containing protein [Achromobacter aegrifaciens]
MNQKIPPGSRNEISILFAATLLVTILFAFLNPIGLTPDEGAHYLRAWEVSRGHWVNKPKSDGIPIQCDEYLFAAKRPDGVVNVAYFDAQAEANLHQFDCTASSRNTANIYPAAPYVFSAAGIRLGESLGLSFKAKLIAARLMNALASCLIVFLGLRVMTDIKRAILFLFLIPGVATQIGSISADSISYALVFRLALNFVDMNQTGVVRRSTAAWTIALSLFLGWSKPVQGLFSVLFGSFLLDKRLNRGMKWTLGVVVPLVTIVAMVVTRTRVSPYLGNGAAPLDQIAFAFSHPFSTFGVFVRSTVGHLHDYILQVSLGIPFKTMSAPWAYAIFGGFVLLAVSAHERSSRTTRLFALGTALLLVAAPIASMYLVYNPPGYKEVLGVQGRYFIPALALVPIMASRMISSLNLSYMLKMAVFAIAPISSLVMVLL